VLIVLVCSAAPVWAQAPPTESTDVREEVRRLRADLQAMQQQYEARIAALEARLQEATAPPSPPPPGAPAGVAPTPPQAPTTATAEVPSGSAGGGGPSGTLPVYGGNTSALSKVFNPDMAAIGDFIGVAGKSPGGGEPSLELHEAEVSLQAVVDPYARADFFLTFGPDGAGVEEGFLTFPALPGGLLMKVGKMRDAFGKVDGQHNHVLPFIDRPLLSKNLLGGEDALSDSGISLSRLIPNPWLFLEATGQVYRGDSAVFKAPTRGDLAYVGHLRAYQDLTESTNIDLGGSVAYGHNGATLDSTTRLLGVDATFRWRPLRRSIYTHVLLRGEAAWSRRSEQPGTPEAFGTYGYLEYQFARRWFGGLRYDNAERAENPTLRDRGGSVILTYWPSEFSQVRAQYRHTQFGEGNRANELLFQFLFAIGAHGAHAF
jgi:hypothetical protein